MDRNSKPLDEYIRGLANDSSHDEGQYLTPYQARQIASVDPDLQDLMKVALSASRGRLGKEEMAMLLSESTMDNMKAFMVMLAKQSLTQVVRLIDALNKLENQLMKRVSESADDMDPGQIAYLIRTLQGSLDRAMTLIDRVSNSNEIQQFILNTQITNIEGDVNVSQISKIIQDPQQRDRLRALVSKVIEQLNPKPPMHETKFKPIDKDAIENSRARIHSVEGNVDLNSTTNNAFTQNDSFDKEDDDDILF